MRAGGLVNAFKLLTAGNWSGVGIGVILIPRKIIQQPVPGRSRALRLPCFRDNIGLRDLPAIRHIRGTDGVIVNIGEPVGMHRFSPGKCSDG